MECLHIYFMFSCMHVLVLQCSCMRACMRAYVCALVRVCVCLCACTCVSVRVYVCVSGMYTSTCAPPPPAPPYHTHKYPCLTLLPDPCTLLYRSKLISDIEDIGGLGKRMQSYLDEPDRGMVCLSSAGLMQTLKRFQHHDQYANVSFHGFMWAYVHHRCVRARVFARVCVCV